MLSMSITDDLASERGWISIIIQEKVGDRSIIYSSSPLDKDILMETFSYIINDHIE